MEFGIDGNYLIKSLVAMAAISLSLITLLLTPNIKYILRSLLPGESNTGRPPTPRSWFLFWVSIFVITIGGIILYAPSGKIFKQEILGLDRVDHFFSFYIDSSWKYNLYHATNENNDDTKETRIGGFADTVLNITSSPEDLVYLVEIERTGMDPRFLWADLEEPDIIHGRSYWIVYDQHRLIIEESLNDATATFERLYYYNIDNTRESFFSPDYFFPLEVDKKWPWEGAIADESSGNSYQWHVQSKSSYSVPAGRFESCYRVQLLVASGIKINWVCPSVGLAAFGYHHFGSAVDYRGELVEIQIP